MKRLRKRLNARKRLRAAWEKIEEKSFWQMKSESPWHWLGGMQGTLNSVALNGFDRATRDYSDQSRKWVRQAIRFRLRFAKQIRRFGI